MIALSRIAPEAWASHGEALRQAGTRQRQPGLWLYRLPTNPRRGSCRHFHDGVDIAAPKGTKVRASADGYVAYAGFSPWDNGSRAYIVIIGHANGYESVYAHLQPKRSVRAGQKVKRGDVIGSVGMTGLTSGPHVHWEIRRGGVDLNPLRAGR